MAASLASSALDASAFAARSPSSPSRILQPRPKCTSPLLGIPKQSPRRPLESVFSSQLISQPATTTFTTFAATRIKIKQRRRLCLSVWNRVHVFLSVKHGDVDDDMLNKAKLASSPTRSCCPSVCRRRRCQCRPIGKIEHFRAAPSTYTNKTLISSLWPLPRPDRKEEGRCPLISGRSHLFTHALGHRDLVNYLRA